MNSLVWLQRDLRLSDHAPLTQALQQSERVIVAYIHDPQQVIGEANSVWLAHSLLSLQTDMRNKGGELLMLEGSFTQQLDSLIRDYQIQQVFYHYEVGQPFVNQQQQALAVCKQHQVALKPFDQAWLNADEIVTLSGSTYAVFSPFYKNLSNQLQRVESPLGVPSGLNKTKITPITDKQKQLPPTLANLIQRPWAKAMMSHWQVGEHQAWLNFSQFIVRHLSYYPDQRDFPGVAGTSKLSIPLHFGELSSRAILHELLAEKTRPKADLNAIDAFIRQLSWREFARYLLHHHPRLETEPFQAKFARFPWDDNAELLSAWQQGKTGFPLIDAAMHELWQTGWMHNRSRMLVASWLTKNANIEWREGQAWFANTLIDADPANNSMGWQWVAGCGVDAAPYYRLFNPLLQSEKFAGDGVYIKKWLPLLSRLPAKFIHAPWLKPNIVASYGIKPGTNYPMPVLNLEQSRLQHIERVAAQKNLYTSNTVEKLTL